MSRPIPTTDQSWRRPLTTGSGGAVVKRTDRFSRKAFAFTGSFAGGWDVTLEGSVDGIQWETVQANITSSTTIHTQGVPLVDMPWKFMRVVGNTIGTDSDAALTISLTGESNP